MFIYGLMLVTACFSCIFYSLLNNKEHLTLTPKISKKKTVQWEIYPEFNWLRSTKCKSSLKPKVVAN